MKKLLTILGMVSLVMILTSGSCSKETEKKGSTWDKVIGGKEDGGEETLTDPEIPDNVYVLAGATDLMKKKAVDWRKAACSSSTRNGAYVYSAMITKYSSNPQKLAARLQVLGFQDIYLSPGQSRIQSADSWLKSFNAACHGYGMKVYALRIAENSLLVKPSNVDNEVSLITDYNAKVSAAQKFDGINADLEVHIAKAGTVSGLQYAWDSSNNYGKGKDNDQLLRLGLEVLTRAGNGLHSAGLQLSQAISYSYQAHFDRGELEYGSTSQFLACCDWVVIMAYLSSKESIWNNSEPVLNAAGKAKSVSIAYKTAMNNVDSASLQTKGWSYLLETSRYLLQKGAAKSAFRGIDVFTYEGLETMWEWTSDKN